MKTSGSEMLKSEIQFYFYSILSFIKCEYYLNINQDKIIQFADNYL